MPPSLLNILSKIYYYSKYITTHQYIDPQNNTYILFEVPNIQCAEENLLFSIIAYETALKKEAIKPT